MGIYFGYMEKEQIINCLEREQRIKYLGESLIKFYIPMYDLLRIDPGSEKPSDVIRRVRNHKRYKYRYLAKKETRDLFEPLLIKEMIGPKITDDMFKKNINMLLQTLQKDIKEYQEEFDMLIKQNKENVCKLSE
jgi:hypothetical protein